MSLAPLDSRQYGLESGQIFARFFLGTEDLHWGFWPKELPVNVSNMAQAQERHSDLIAQHLPPGTRTVLDVGGGSGQFAERLTASGLQVDVVIPSEHLGRRIRERLPASSHVYVSRFEDMTPRQQYDVVLFSESFQYIPVPAALAQAAACLSPGGHLIICDYFRLATPGKPPVGGGHRLTELESGLAAAPFTELTRLDVTDEAAPTCELLGQFIEQVAGPLKDLTGQYMQHHHPFIAKVLGWKLRKKLAKVHRKYFSGRFSADAFRAHFQYLLLVQQRRES